MSLIGLLIMLLIVCVVVWAARMLLGAFNVPQPIATVVYVVIVLIFVLWLLQALGGLGGLGEGGSLLRIR